MTEKLSQICCSGTGCVTGIWKLRDELSAALDKVDLSGIELYVAAAPGEEDRGYWWLNANPKIWSYSDIAVLE